MEVDDDVVLATDGSIEGLLTGLSMRPGRPSIFLRDEFSGLLEMIAKRDYYAGMAEMLTKLYDGKVQKRMLRKEIIEVRDPRLIVFAGGIRNKITGLLTTEHVSSGFMPRFIFITAESDVSKVRPLGPPTEVNLGERDSILAEMVQLSQRYAIKQTVTIKGINATVEQPRTFNANLTPQAWARFNKLEADMMDSALQSERPDIMTPTYDRLCKSTLKAAVLIAATRVTDDVIVEESDLCHAMFYLEDWRKHTVLIINNVGKGENEREFDKVLRAVQRTDGINRSTLMQNYHLQARQADNIFTTLEQRGLITRARVGRSERIFLTSHGKEVDLS